MRDALGFRPLISRSNHPLCKIRQQILHRMTWRRYLSHRLTWLAVLVALGIGALFARSVWTLRNDEWAHAQQTNDNLIQTLEQGLRWTLDAYDNSLRGVVREVSRPDVWDLPPELQARVVFNDSLDTRGMADFLVLDAQGTIVLDSASSVPRQLNFADRDYFLAFQKHGHNGLFVGAPVLARTTGTYVMPLARGYYTADGAFAGIVLGGVRLAHFTEHFAALDMGVNSGVNLVRSDGLVISRFGYSSNDVGRSLVTSANFQRMKTEQRGSFVGVASIDAVERLYTFRTVGDYPLILNVAQSTEVIFAKWFRNAVVVGAFAVLLMAASLGLALLFVRELALRQAVSQRLKEAEHDMRTIIDNLPSMIGYWDHELRNRFVNRAYFDWFGKRPDEIRGVHIGDLLGANLMPANQPFIDGALRGEPQLFELTMVDMLGTERHTMTSCIPDVEDGKVHGFFVQVTDISERKRMENDLFEEKERVRLSLQSIGDAVVCADANGGVTYLNPVAERLTGWQAFDAANHKVSEVIKLYSVDTDTDTDVGDDSDTLLPCALQRAMHEGCEVRAVQGFVKHRTSGQRFRVEITASPIKDRYGAVAGAVAVLRDVTDAVAMAERMAHLAHYDALTDLPNRVLLHDRSQVVIAQARRDVKTMAVMYLDLDGFKGVNDRLGHAVGDQLLVQFAQRLKLAVRASDTVCRQGGDEFVVLLAGLSGVEPALAVARKIMSICEAPFELAGEAVPVGLSGGIALYPQHGDSFDALSRHADSAMYAAKNAGRMQFMLYQGPDSAPVPVLPRTVPPEAELGP